VLSALKEKVIRVRQDGGTGSWLATTSIGGHGDAVPLKAVHVQMSAKAWVPTVAYVELFGGAGEYEQVGASGVILASCRRAMLCLCLMFGFLVDELYLRLCVFSCVLGQVEYEILYTCVSAFFACLFSDREDQRCR
jgi:hypothetical protein